MSSSWTSKPHFSGGCAFLKGFSRGSFGLACALLLASCGASAPAGYPGSPESTTQSDTLQPLTVPPNATERPPAPGTTGAPKTADGLPALQVKGNNTALFSQRMSDEADRLERLENAVQELRNDFDAVTPAIVRLVAIESDIQALIKQLEAITGDPSGGQNAPYDEAEYNPPVYQQPAYLPPIPQDIPADENAASGQTSLPAISSPSAPVAQEQAEIQDGSTIPAVEPLPPATTDGAQAPPVAATTPPATSPGAPQVITPQAPALASNVMDIRVGEHPGKTRLVLDISGKSPFTADLDNLEKILVVEIPQAGWNAAAQKDFAASPLIASYRIERLDNGGTLLIVQLKKAAAISYKGSMDDPGKGQRLIIDLTLAP